MPRDVLCYSDGFGRYVYVANEMLVFLSPECSLFMKLCYCCLYFKNVFCVYTLIVMPEFVTVKQNEHGVCCGMDIVQEKYNVKHYGKQNIVLLNTCFLYLYFLPDCVVQYLGTYHNNVTHIYSGLDYDFKSYRDIFLTWPCLQRYFKHENHEVVLHSYKSKIYDWIFHQKFCFALFEFYL